MRRIVQEMSAGYCCCGCGQKTKISKFNSSAKNWVKGQPRKFISGHNKRNMIPFAERFWAKVDIKGPAECWLWKGDTLASGYARVSITHDHYIGSRVAWELTYGPIPKDLLACHKCDNPPCCNPNHLFLGTAKDNHNDMVQKGRCKTVKILTDEIVFNIRLLHVEGLSNPSIAKKLNISRPTIWDVVNRRCWKHI
jgi:hypothetical protein